VLNSVFRTKSESLYEYFKIISRIGERMNNMGFHGGVANVLATEDIALNPGPEKGIVFTIYMPSLILGTVGGGTHLPTQKESLEILGCYGDGNVRKFAEVIASFCIAMDLSTFSAIDAGEFCNAHEALGRKKHLPKP
jgi:hypothetical protein